MVYNGGYGVVGAASAVHAGAAASIFKDLNAHAARARLGEVHKGGSARGGIEGIPDIIVRGVAAAAAGRGPGRGARGFVACAGAVGIYAHIRGVVTFVIRGAGAYAHGEAAGHTAGNPHVVQVVYNGGYGVVGAVSAVHAGAAASIFKDLNAHAARARLGEVHEGGSARGGIEVVPHIIVRSVATAAAGRGPGCGACGFVACAVAVGVCTHTSGIAAFIIERSWGHMGRYAEIVHGQRFGVCISTNSSIGPAQVVIATSGDGKAAQRSGHGLAGRRVAHEGVVDIRAVAEISAVVRSTRCGSIAVKEGPPHGAGAIAVFLVVPCQVEGTDHAPRVVVQLQDDGTG